MNISDEGDSESAVPSSSSDKEIKAAKKNLKLLKKKQKARLRKETLEKIELEAKEIEKSLKKPKKSKKKKDGDKVTTVGSLREMDEVVAEVDKLMDQHMSLRNPASNSESESDVKSDVIVSGRKAAKKDQGSRAEKKTSGKSKNLLDSDCEFPQKWPHNFLNPHFVNCKDKKTYEELTMSEFCAAYMTILEKEY